MTAFDKPILLIGRENMNRAVQGDIVAVEVFDEKAWKAPGDEVVEQESKFFTAALSFFCLVLTVDWNSDSQKRRCRCVRGRER